MSEYPSNKGNRAWWVNDEKIRLEVAFEGILMEGRSLAEDRKIAEHRGYTAEVERLTQKIEENRSRLRALVPQMERYLRMYEREYEVRHDTIDE